MKRYLILLLVALAVSTGAAARQPERGYRGFVEWSNSLRSMSYDDDWRINQYYTGVSTSHGYQINPTYFVGGGLDWVYWHGGASHIMAFFAQGRADFKFNDRFTPFADVRLGYNVAMNGGVYFSPSIGSRFNWGRKVGLNAGLGMTVQGYSENTFDVVTGPEGYVSFWKTGKRHSAIAFFTFRVGIDF